MSTERPKHRFLSWAKGLLKRNRRDPLDCGDSPPEPELARFGSLRLTPRRIVQSYSWKQSTAPLARVVRVDVQRIHTRTWLLMATLCLLSGWGMQIWQELELFMLVGISGGSVCLFFYLLSRRTRLTINLEDGSEIDMAVRNKHFSQASQFANIVCRVCTMWEPTRPSVPLDSSNQPSSKATIEIEDDDMELELELELDSELEQDTAARVKLAPALEENPTTLITEAVEEGDEPTVEVSNPPPAGWLKMEEPA